MKSIGKNVIRYIELSRLSVNQSLQNIMMLFDPCSLLHLVEKDLVVVVVVLSSKTFWTSLYRYGPIYSNQQKVKIVFCVVKKNVLLNITREFGDERQSMCTWNIVKNTTVVSLFHGNHVVGGRKCKINGPKSFLSFIIYYFVITSIILSGICSIQDPK